MKGVYFLVLIIFTFSCSNKKSETELLKEQLDEQRQRIEEQDKKISNLENSEQENLHPSDFNYEDNINTTSITNNLNILDIISFRNLKNSEIENHLIKNQWIFSEKSEKHIYQNHKKKLLSYRNKASDSEILIIDFSSIRKIIFKTTNENNFNELISQLISNNFKLKNPNYDMGKQFDLNEPVVGEKKIINSTAQLYSNSSQDITINFNTYVVVNEVLNDEDGTYKYSEDSKEMSFEIYIN